MSELRRGPSSGPPPKPATLYKHKSWSPDIHREEAWLRRKDNNRLRCGGRSKSVTDDDLDELRACLELGFGFDSPDLDPKLSKVLPALELYCAVNKQYNHSLSRTSSSLTASSDGDANSSTSIIDPNDKPEEIKTRLRQWAQVVACVVRHSSSI